MAGPWSEITLNLSFWFSKNVHWIRCFVIVVVVVVVVCCCCGGGGWGGGICSCYPVKISIDFVQQKQQKQQQQKRRKKLWTYLDVKYKRRSDYSETIEK